MLHILTSQRSYKAGLSIQGRRIRTRRNSFGVTLQRGAEHLRNELFELLRTETGSLGEYVGFSEDFHEADHEDVPVPRFYQYT